jgi:hypothetical protein
MSACAVVIARVFLKRPAPAGGTRTKHISLEHQQHNDRHQVCPKQEQEAPTESPESSYETVLVRVHASREICREGKGSKEQQEPKRSDGVAHLEWTNMVCRSISFNIACKERS